MSVGEASKKGISADNRVWTVLFVSLIILNLLSSSMAQMNTAATPTLVTAHGGTGVYGGALVATFVVAAMISRIVSGNLADAYSRRGVLISGAIIYLIGCAIPIVIGDLIPLVPARILQGWGFAACHTAASTAAADVLPKARLGEGIGYYGLGHALAMALGPMLGFWLVDFSYLHALAAGAGCLSIIVLVISLTVRYEKHPERLPETSGYRTSRLPETEEAKQAAASKAAAQKKKGFSFKDLFEISALRGGIPLFLVAVPITFFLSFATLFARGLGYENPSLFFMVAAAVAVIVRFTGSKLFDRLAPLVVFIIPIAVGLLTLAGIYFVHNEIVYYICGAGYGICLGFSMPLLSSVAVKASPPDRWGAANALFYCLYDAGIGISAVLLGALLDFAGFGWLFLVAALCAVASFISGIFLFPKSEKS